MFATFLTLTVLPIIVSRVDRHGIDPGLEFLRRRLARGRRPVNHDLERAGRKAVLQATALLTRHCLAAAGHGGRWSRLRLGAERPPEVEALQRLGKAVREELGEVHKSSYHPPRLPETEGRSDLLIAAAVRDDDLERTVELLERQLHQRLLEELSARELDPPQVFVELLETGWDEDGPDGVVHTTWFDLVRQCFVHELKHDTVVNAAFQAEIVSQIPAMAEDVAGIVRELEAVTAAALPALERLERDLATAFEAQGATLDAILRSLEALADHQDEDQGWLRLLQDASGEQARQALRDFVIAQVAESPAALELTEVVGGLRALAAFHSWRGALVASRVEELVSEHEQHVFVGREPDLTALEEFVTGRPSGCLLVTAPPGHGKSALLVRGLRQLESRGCFVAHHFFSNRDSATSSVVQGCQNLLRQLRVYYEDADLADPSDLGGVRDKLFALLKRGRRDSPLVVLVDGLDEADGRFEDFLPRPLPDGVHVVVSGRADHGEDPGYLRDWSARADSSHYVHRLGAQALAGWLGSVPSLAHLAADAEFLQLFLERTDGEARYVHHVVEEMKHAVPARDPRTVLDTAPQQFSDYVGDSVEQLRQRLRPAQWSVFALLSCARGALTDGELVAISTADPQGRLRLLAFDYADVARLKDDWAAMRWLHVRESPDGFDTWAFARRHEARIVAGHLRAQGVALQSLLRTWCSQWSQHEPGWEYAFRHYAGHLLAAVPEHQEGRTEPTMPAREQLYALCEDEGFADAQRKALPAEPDLPIRTVQAALQAAARTDDAGGIVRLLLLHARRLVQVRHSPIDVLRLQGSGHARARAELAVAHERVLWHLLVAAELADDDEDAAREVLLGVQWHELEALVAWRHQVAALLAQVFAVDAELVTRSVGRLGPDARALFVDSVLERCRAGDWRDPARVPELLTLTAGIAGDLAGAVARASALARVAAALAVSGSGGAAESCAERAQAIAFDADEPVVPPALLAEVAGAWVALGEPARAVQVASAVVDGPSRVRALLDLVPRLGSGPARQDALDLAHWTASASGGWWRWQSVLAVVETDGPRPAGPAGRSDHGAGWVSSWLAGRGDVAAEELLGRFRTDDEQERASVATALLRQLPGDAREEVVVGAARLAEQSAEQLDGVDRRVSALLDVAEVMAGRGLAPHPLATVRELLRSSIPSAEQARHARRLVGVARAAGLVEEADQDLREAERVVSRLPGAPDRATGLLLLAPHSADREAALQGVLDEVQSMIDPDQRLASLEDVAWMAVALGQHEVAQAAAAACAVAVQLVDDPGRRAFWCLRLAHVPEVAPDPPQRRAWLQAAVEAAAAFSDRSQQVTDLAHIAVKASRLGVDEPVEAALRAAGTALDGIRDPERRGGMKAILLAARTVVHGAASTLQDARNLEDLEARAFALWSAARALRLSGQVGLSHELLREAATAAAALEDPSTQGTALALVADSWSRGGGSTPWRVWELVSSDRSTESLDGDTAVAVGAVRRATELIEADRLEEGRDALARVGPVVEPLGGAQRAAWLAVVGYLAAKLGWTDLAQPSLLAARTAAQSAPSPLDAVHALCGVSSVARACGAQDEAAESLRAAVAAADEVAGPMSRLDALQTLAPLHDGARRELEDLHRVAPATASMAAVQHLLAVARAQARAGLRRSTSEALRSAQRLGSELAGHERAAVLIALGELAGLPVELRPEEEDESRTQSLHRQVRLLLQVAAGFHVAGDPVRARRTFAEARRAAEPVADQPGPALLAEAERAEAAVELTGGPDVAEPPAGPWWSASQPPVAPAQVRDRIAVVLRRDAQLPRLAAWSLTAIDESFGAAAPPQRQSDAPEVTASSSTAAAAQGAQQASRPPRAADDQPARSRQALDLAGRIPFAPDDAPDAAATQQAVLALNGRVFLSEAVLAAQRGDRDGFESFLIPCAYHPEVLAELCAVVARVYPLQVQRVRQALEDCVGQAVPSAG